MLVEWYTTTHSATPAARKTRTVTDETKQKAMLTRKYNSYVKMTTTQKTAYRTQNGGAPARPAHLKVKP
jgi:hypothetical protein